MSYDTPIAPSLFDLIARSWTLPGAVTGAVFNRDASAVAFASDGRVAVMSIADPERPETPMRVAADTGRATIQPRKAPPRPATEAKGVSGGVVAHGEESFLTGLANGGVASITPRAQVTPRARALEGHATARRTSCSRCRRRCARSPSRPAAAGSPQRTTAASRCGTAATLRRPYPSMVSPPACAGARTGAFLACGFDAPGFALIRRAGLEVDRVDGYPKPVRSFGWNAGAGAFVTSGAFRTTVWAFGADGRGASIETGRAGLVVVDRIAVAPRRAADRCPPTSFEPRTDG